MSILPPERDKPGPDQESVWDYPRPPRLEPVADRIRVIFNGETITDTTSAYRVLETSHPPTYYIPQDDVARDVLVLNERRSVCEWKGEARYFDVVVHSATATQAAWSYPAPTPGFEIIRDYVAFYAHCMEACFVGEERVQHQAGDFYGGWITSKVVGPFKGAPGTRFW